jgi:hypothetical protein
MIDAMYWLVNGAKTDDSLFFHCKDDIFSSRCLAIELASVSGHGSQIRDEDGDEVDGYDEGMNFGIRGPHVC